MCHRGTSILPHVSVGLAFTALLLGFRHGFDWDHIAAIADLTGTSENRRRGFVLSFFYAVGHALVVFALGVIAIIFGLAIPDGLDDWMGRVVGLTLIALGAWVLIDLARNGRNFRLRSRWMLVLGGAFSGMRRVRGSNRRKITVEHEHRHPHATDAHETEQHNEAFAHDHSHVEIGHSDVETELDIDLTDDLAVGVGKSRWQRHGHGHGESQTHRHGHSHRHSHRHDLELPNAATASYGGGAATGIGMLHGVGIESPTQIAVFVASTAAVGWGFGVALLLAWCVGLVVANAIIAVIAGAGLLQAERNFGIYAGIAVVVSLASIGLGVLYLIA